jgi:hypothetical protein
MGAVAEDAMAFKHTLDSPGAATNESTGAQGSNHHKIQARNEVVLQGEAESDGFLVPIVSANLSPVEDTALDGR